MPNLRVRRRALGQLAVTLGASEHRIDHGRAQAAALELGYGSNCRTSRRAHHVLEHTGMRARLLQILGGTQNGLLGHRIGLSAWHALDDRGVCHGLDEQAHVGRRRTGNGNNCIHQMLGNELSFAKSAEQLMNVLALSLGHVAVRAQSAHRLTHHCSKVRHNAHNLVLGAEKALKALKGNASSDGDDNGILIDGRSKCLDNTVKILRLHSDNDSLGVSHGLTVVAGTLATQLASKPLLRCLGHIGDHNVLSSHETGSHDALEHRPVADVEGGHGEVVLVSDVEDRLAGRAGGEQREAMGEHVGREKAIAYIQEARARSREHDVELEIVDALTSADRFALVVIERFTQDGEVVEIPRTNVYRVRGEEIDMIWIFEGDQYAADALMS